MKNLKLIVIIMTFVATLFSVLTYVVLKHTKPQASKLEEAYQRGYTQGAINGIISERAKSKQLFEIHRKIDSTVYHYSVTK